MDSKFWGSYKVARAAKFAPGGSLTLISGAYSQRPGPQCCAAGCDQCRHRRAGTWPRAGSCSCTRECDIAGIDEDTSLCGHGTESARSHDAECSELTARAPRGRSREHRRGDPFRYDQPLSHRGNDYGRRRGQHRIGKLTFRSPNPLVRRIEIAASLRLGQRSAGRVVSVDPPARHARHRRGPKRLSPCQFCAGHKPFQSVSDLWVSIRRP